MIPSFKTIRADQVRATETFEKHPALPEAPALRNWVLETLDGEPLDTPSSGEWVRTTCPHCGADMFKLVRRPWLSRERYASAYCSSDCLRADMAERNRRYVRAHRERHPAPKKPVTERACACCGETFTAKREDALYCSPGCRQRARRDRCGG